MKSAEEWEKRAPNQEFMIRFIRAIQADAKRDCITTVRDELNTPGRLLSRAIRTLEQEADRLEGK
jgi:hypothetical protein